MKKSQSGFTLIELVVVIVLLGILGVTALGRFQDLSGDAESAALQGVASELSASTAINYAGGVIDGTFTVDLDVANVCTTAILEDLLQSQTWPTTISINATAGNCLAAAAGVAVQCTLENADASETSIAYVICTA